MKKVLMCIFIFICVILNMSFIVSANETSAAAQKNPIGLKINGEDVQTDFPPVIIDGRTLVPARAIFEKTGGKVQWDQGEKKVTVSTKSILIELVVGQPTAKVNGKEVAIDVPPQIISGRTLLPVRFVSEWMNMKVMWNQQDRIVDLYVSNINDIVYRHEGNEAVVAINLDYYKNYSVFTLDNPSRLVVDFPNVNISKAQENIQVGSNPVNAIRSAVYDGNTARVVLDLKESTEYRIKENENQLCLYTPLKIVSEEEEDNNQVSDPEGTSPQEGEDKDNEDSQSGELEGIPPPGVDSGEKEKTRKLVIIDPGHGDHDPGAVANGLKEKDVNLDIALRLEALLKKEDIDIYMTRRDDTFVELDERTRIANSLDGDLFLSIHNNAYTSSVKGTETFYHKHGGKLEEESKIFAQIVQKKLLDSLGTVDRKVKTANYVVIKKTNMPSVLTEIGFLTNSEDAKRLADEGFRQKTAQALYEAIMEMLKR